MPKSYKTRNKEAVGKALKSLRAGNWWSKLSASQKREYILKHPNSKYAKKARQSVSIMRVAKKIKNKR